MSDDLKTLPPEAEPCPSCGALPCDWVNNPHVEAQVSQRIAALEAQVAELGAELDATADALASMLALNSDSQDRDDAEARLYCVQQAIAKHKEGR